MKKTILPVIGILAILLTFSCTNSNFKNERIIKVAPEKPNFKNERIVKVTSQKPIEFDMAQNGIITKGIKTPYEFKFVGNEGNFIFKSKKEKEVLKLSVEDNYGSLSANSGIIVLMIENDNMKTFGMN